VRFRSDVRYRIDVKYRSDVRYRSDVSYRSDVRYRIDVRHRPAGGSPAVPGQLSPNPRQVDSRQPHLYKPPRKPREWV